MPDETHTDMYTRKEDKRRDALTFPSVSNLRYNLDTHTKSATLEITIKFRVEILLRSRELTFTHGDPTSCRLTLPEELGHPQESWNIAYIWKRI